MGDFSLDPKVRRYLDGYRALRVTADVWSVIASDVRAAVALSAGSLVVAKKQCSHVAAYASWLHREGLSTELVGLSDLETVERYIQVGMTGSADSSRAARRATLRRVACRIAPSPYPVPSPIGYRRARPPYEGWQVRRYLQLARDQPTQGRRRSTVGILALGLGCGLDGRDMGWVRGVDVQTRPNDETTIRIYGGSRPRTVTALDEYAPLLAECAQRAGDELIIGGTQTGRHNVTSVALAQMISDPSLPRLLASRLRSTWLLHHLNLSTPLPVLMAAAGLVTARPLEDLLPYITPIPSAQAALALRGVT
jgi:hypothetical protein